MKINEYPKVWNWGQERKGRPLSEWRRAPDTNGFYELGFLIDGNFDAMYCGRAAGCTLRQRLRKHY